MAIHHWFHLQLFADGGEGGGDGAAAAATGENSAAPDAGEARLRELGVPESVLARRAKRGNKAPALRSEPVQAQPQQKQEQSAGQDAAADTEQTPEEGSTTEKPADKPARMSWDEIMADPEYNRKMQETVQSRLRAAKGAEEALKDLAPVLDALSTRYGLDPAKLDAKALAKSFSDDNANYEEKAMEMGVPVETAKRIVQNEQESARRKAEEERSIQEQMIEAHLAKLREQGEAMKGTFPHFDLAAELRNPAFARMTSPQVNISVEDAYYAVHRKEIQQAAMQATAQKTAQQIANSIRSGQQRPVENGTTGQAPSVTTFDYAHASKEQREELKRRIRESAAQGKKLYPGQF